MPLKGRFGGPTKLPPPKKPLPSTPVRPPPLRPFYKPKTLLAKDVSSTPSQPLLVMVPPTNSKPAGTRASNPLSKPLKPVAPQRPLPGLKVHPASFAFKK
ncbi:PREDICTED: gibberellin-regulated protein 14-like [Thamnophis sirtalis]|uniref:Gibberellin-regulated protein 14-like n=1 Tax=Thamnophis sirtalis TaxID=35019 RepID=A0A6I9Y5X3_9SAUR|nr:PREDICTED: gibberellin-regulated protein 14-like [Thamnophis sirtalis]